MNEQDETFLNNTYGSFPIQAVSDWKSRKKLSDATELKIKRKNGERERKCGG